MNEKLKDITTAELFQELINRFIQIEMDKENLSTQVKLMLQAASGKDR